MIGYSTIKNKGVVKKKDLKARYTKFKRSQQRTEQNIVPYYPMFCTSTQ